MFIFLRHTYKQLVSYFEPPQPDYSKYSTTKLLVIPITLLSIAILVLVAWTLMTGAPVDRAMVFTGGTEVRIDYDSGITDNPEEQIRDAFSEDETDSITAIAASDSYVVNFGEGDITAEEVEDRIDEKEGLTISELSTVNPSLGSDAQLTALYGVLVAFLLMSALVIVLFRSGIPAVVIVLSAVSNILVAGASMNIFGIELSLGTVGALLMLIGYSVDSDILLNDFILRNKGPRFSKRVHKAMRTGVTMTVTSLSAMVVMFIVASIFGVDLLADMGFVLAVGLSMDLINTYMMNVSILRWYDNRRDKS